MKPTEEQVIAWMEEASDGRQPDGWGVMLDDEQLKRFAALAYEAGRKDENEACAKVAEDRKDTGDATGIQRDVEIWNMATKSCAAAIRARREQ